MAYSDKALGDKLFFDNHMDSIERLKRKQAARNATALSPEKNKTFVNSNTPES